MRRIGLIGGTSWESSAHYYRALNEGVRDRLGGLHSADLVLRSLEFDEIAGLQAAGAWEDLGVRYASEARLLRDAGAQLIGIAANTMHLVADEVAAASGLPVVHIVDASGAVLRRLEVRRVGLIGTAYTMESDLYPARLERLGIEVLVPDAEDRAMIHRVIYEELTQGIVEDSSRKAHLGVIDRLVDRGAQAVLLGCTEHTMLLGSEDGPVPLLDTTAIHVAALLDAALDEGSAA
ncbi:MAG TPA: aspartate/glutamate racemase family protein [Actinomycetes bacterium]|nr:aspartate/glutamate racemase family protein [Actinomycetes bacterium]